MILYPPAVISIRIDGDRDRFRLWLPVFILWPLLILGAAVALPLAAVAEVALAPRGIRPFSVLIALSGVIGSLHGTDINVVSNKNGNRELVKLFIL